MTEGGRSTTFGPYGPDAMVEAMALQARAFVRAALVEGKPTAAGDDGLAALRLSLATIRSLESGESVVVGE